MSIFGNVVVLDRTPKMKHNGKKSALKLPWVFTELLTFFMNSFWLSGKGLKEIEVEMGQWVIDFVWV